MTANLETTAVGEWWLPEYPDQKVPGVLSLEDEENPVLIVHGTLSEHILAARAKGQTSYCLSAAVDQQDIVLGTTTDGEKSLFKCDRVTQKISRGGVSEVWRCDLLMSGTHLISYDDRRFSSARLSIGYLTQLIATNHSD